MQLESSPKLTPFTDISAAVKRGVHFGKALVALNFHSDHWFKSLVEWRSITEICEHLQGAEAERETLERLGSSDMKSHLTQLTDLEVWSFICIGVETSPREIISFGAYQLFFFYQGIMYWIMMMCVYVYPHPLFVRCALNISFSEPDNGSMECRKKNNYFWKLTNNEK